MHICLLTPSFPPMVDGGGAISPGRLVQYLLRRGHQITVVSTAPLVYPGGSPSMPSGVVQPGMALHYGLVEDPLRAASAVEALRVWAQAQHQRKPFDVILAYFIYPAGYLATMLGEVLGVPVVCSCRGNDISKDMFITPEIIAAVLTRSTRLIFVSTSSLHMPNP